MRRKQPPLLIQASWCKNRPYRLISMRKDIMSSIFKNKQHNRKNIVAPAVNGKILVEHKRCPGYEPRHSGLYLENINRCGELGHIRETCSGSGEAQYEELDRVSNCHLLVVS